MLLFGKNDAAGIVSEKVSIALSSITKTELLPIETLYERIGLPQGYPFLRTTLDAYKEYQGKGMVTNQLRFGHPDVIAQLKANKQMK